MTYESPITLIQTQTDNFIKEINDKTDEVILKAVVNVLPQVNKEELIKALSYDREQYSKGYKDRDAEIVRCKECKYRCKEPIYSNSDPQWIIYSVGDCEVNCKTVGDDDFCSWGERREP